MFTLTGVTHRPFYHRKDVVMVEDLPDKYRTFAAQHMKLQADDLIVFGKITRKFDRLQGKERETFQRRRNQRTNVAKKRKRLERAAERADAKKLKRGAES